MEKRRNMMVETRSHVTMVLRIWNPTTGLMFSRYERNFSKLKLYLVLAFRNFPAALTTVAIVVICFMRFGSFTAGFVTGFAGDAAGDFDGDFNGDIPGDPIGDSFLVSADCRRG